MKIKVTLSANDKDIDMFGRDWGSKEAKLWLAKTKPRVEKIAKLLSKNLKGKIVKSVRHDWVDGNFGWYAIVKTKEGNYTIVSKGFTDTLIEVNSDVLSIAEKKIVLDIASSVKNTKFVANGKQVFLRDINT